MWLLLAIALPLTRALFHGLGASRPAPRFLHPSREGAAPGRARRSPPYPSGRPVRENAAQQETLDPLGRHSHRSPATVMVPAGDVLVTGNGELGRTARARPGAAGAVGQPQRQEQEPRTRGGTWSQASECFYQRHAVRQAGQVGRCAALGRPDRQAVGAGAGDARCRGSGQSSRAGVPSRLPGARPVVRTSAP